MWGEWMGDDKIILNQNTGCEYCKQGKILKSCNFGGSANLIVAGDILDIYGDENKFQIFKRIYRPRFDINYCPMCGRKLEGE